MENEKSEQILTEGQPELDPHEKNHGAPMEGGMEFLHAPKPNFEINRFFNELPVRILGSQEYPCFYADDLARILDIKKVRNVVKDFDETEIVSKELREQLGIVTYRKYKESYRRDNTVILLTEFGVYKLIMITKSQISTQLKKFVYRVLHELRTKGKYEIEQELQQLRITHEQTLKENGMLEIEIRSLRKKQDKFKNLTERLYLFEYDNDPLKIVQDAVLPEDVDSDYEDDFPPEYNQIDDLALYYRMFPNAMNDPPYTYKITPSPTPNDFASLRLVHSVWVKSAKEALSTLERQFASERVENTKSTIHYYETSAEKIIQALDGVAE